MPGARPGLLQRGSLLGSSRASGLLTCQLMSAWREAWSGFLAIAWSLFPISLGGGGREGGTRCPALYAGCGRAGWGD